VEKFKVGQLVEGVITRLTKFGAFARLEGDLEGLIHISEISENRIEHPKEAGLHEADVVTLRIIRIDPEQRRIGLSLRKVDSGAFKDLDLKQITLEGVNLELTGDAAAPEEAPKQAEPPVAEEPPAAPEEAPKQAEPPVDEEPPAAPEEAPKQAEPPVDEEPPAAPEEAPKQAEPPIDEEPPAGETPE
jgi:predicted RNA-binding protein with RPS1 domain